MPLSLVAYKWWQQKREGERRREERKGMRKEGLRAGLLARESSTSALTARVLAVFILLLLFHLSDASSVLPLRCYSRRVRVLELRQPRTRCCKLVLLEGVDSLAIVTGDEHSAVSHTHTHTHAHTHTQTQKHTHDTLTRDRTRPQTRMHDTVMHPCAFTRTTHCA